MKLNEYIKNLQEIAEQHPDLEVVYSTDSEGNHFDRVYFTPTLGCFTGYNYFYTEEEFVDWEGENLKLNAVCIN